METKLYQDLLNRITDNCSKVILGKNESIKLITVSFLCKGHVLLEDVPGTGKTVLFRAFAKSVGKDFKRIQFTPDLMPSDITGINFYNMKTGEFNFRRGPIFANIVLADEINRATPRTQSALLEAMAEGQTTIDGKTYTLETPFMVAATQNPLESGGTFPLPEAQLDRFFMKLSLGYMDRASEIAVMKREETSALLSETECVVDSSEFDRLFTEFKNVKVNDCVTDYIMDIIEATRSSSSITVGASTRGAMALYLASQAYAAVSGRDYVIPEDVKTLAGPVLVHRLSFRGVLNTIEKEKTFNDLLATVQVPTEVIG
ncbi:MAG: AAA family ATPase [Lachnospiraceae bacterium]|nr:AAA family ATPase [Lachnospiraceae bacterium]